MKTKNSKRFALFCLLMLLVVGAQGQTWKYPKVEDGNTIVSRDAAGGIKSDALLTAAQKTFLMKTTQPIYNELSEYNKVSAKFQVASVDASTPSAWTDAYTLCKSYSESDAPAGSWRMPTQRELMLMWMFKSKLTNCGSITSANGTVWSGTEESSDTDRAKSVIFSDGSSRSDDKIYSSYYVRCVRDL